MALVDIELILNGDMNKIFSKATKKSVEALAIQATSEAKLLAPVQEKNGGRLRNSIMWKTKSQTGGLDDKSGEKAVYKVDETVKDDSEAIVGLNLDYGIYQEFGTRKMAPQPFLRPSLAIMQGKAKDVVTKEINEEIKRGTLTATKIRETFI